MTREQRDATIHDLNETVTAYIEAREALLTATTATTSNNARTSAAEADKREKEVARLEKRLSAMLLDMQWQYRAASWSAEWWKTDECWVAPWVTKEEDNSAGAGEC